ncbi:MAG: S8 family peptidase [Betaproteobacteria bacterium]|nr:S8 family peptidase [Betaproteobacteria bacterium]
MSEQQRPLLLFPRPTSSEREKRTPGWAQVHVPPAQRQAERLTPKFGTLQTAFDARRIQLQATAPTDDPEFVVVFETVGSVENFIGAVQRTPGLEWLLEADEAGVEPDNDFYDQHDREKPLDGRVYLLGSNRQALSEVISLWNRYKADQRVKLEHGLGKWKDVFKHLRDVRFWGVQDRIGPDIREYWESRLAHGEDAIRFEVEAWCYSSPDKNDRTAVDLRRLVSEIGGHTLNTALIQDIAYHGFLVEMPASGIRSLLSETPPALVQSERVMLFRPRGQALPLPEGDELRLPWVEGSARTSSGQPVVALLDGLPLQNHPLLAGRLSVDDPDGWESEYPARDRGHGTAMASLILYGELDGPRVALAKPIYARPIMRPDPADSRVPKQETTPDNVLLIDLVHRSVKRIFDGEGNGPAAAPTVKVINLSVGDLLKPFDTELSPWARLLDWLSSKYQVLFVVSAGNVPAQLILPIARGTLSTLPADARQRLAVSALVAESVGRRLLTPGESINAITVGSVHADGSTFMQAANRYDLFPDRGISPYSCIGHGFRRAVKPDILMPGGRALHRERHTDDPRVSELQIVNTAAAPGHRVAAPPDPSGQNTKYARGTSNATALATRGAAQAHSVIEALRAGSPDRLPDRLDAVLLKALLVHGAEWGGLEAQIIDARPEIEDWRQRQSLVTRFVGYGVADIDRAITCTEQRATLIGTGELRDGQALEFRVPLPPSLNARMVKRRLTITLAWMSPVNPRHAKYRAARLWIKPPDGDFSVSRMNCDWQRVQRGTVQHEVLEGESAIAFVEGADLVFRVNCAEDGGKLLAPVPFALCVTIEVGEGVELPIYQEILERVSTRVGVPG